MPSLTTLPSGSNWLAQALRQNWPALSEETAGSLAALFRVLQLDRQAAVLMQGERWQQALLVETGLLRLHFTRRDGREFNKSFYADGMLVCPLTLSMREEPSLFGISAIEPTRVWVAPSAAFDRELQRHGLWAGFNRDLLERLVGQKLQREHDLLMLDAEQRYRVFCERHPQLADRVPLLHLASYLGMTDVSLSRVRRRIAERASRTAGARGTAVG